MLTSRLARLVAAAVAAATLTAGAFGAVAPGVVEHDTDATTEEAGGRSSTHSLETNHLTARIGGYTANSGTWS